MNGQPADPLPLRGQRIYVLSPDRWGTMRLSKHHYAIALARRGNEVFYINPPQRGARGVTQVPVEGVPGLHVVTYAALPLFLRFKLPALYDAFQRRQIARLRTALGPPDIVWCFDGHTFADLRWFGASRRIYHPVDMMRNARQPRLAASAEAILSVATEILDDFAGARAPRLLLPHGLSEEFAQLALHHTPRPFDFVHRVRVGYAGSLFKPSTDYPTFQRLITENPDVEFHIWSPTSLESGNVAGYETEEVRAFLAFLASRENVRLRGLQPTSRLAREMQEMDLFLFCDELRRSINRNANSHKILEYLSTGKAVVSTYLSAYVGNPLVTMLPTPENEHLPALFANAIADLATLNGTAQQSARVKHALDRTYERHIARIEQLMEKGWEQSAVAPQGDLAVKLAQNSSEVEHLTG